MRLSLDKVSFSRFYSILPVRIGSIDWYDCLGYFIVTFQYCRLRMLMEKFMFWGNLRVQRSVAYISYKNICKIFKVEYLLFHEI